jgi:hypothetical protein
VIDLLAEHEGLFGIGRNSMLEPVFQDLMDALAHLGARCLWRTKPIEILPAPLALTVRIDGYLRRRYGHLNSYITRDGEVSSREVFYSCGRTHYAEASRARTQRARVSASA